jgi:hypothetical protein
LQAQNLLASSGFTTFFRGVGCDRSNGRDQWLLTAPNPYHTWSHAIEFPIRYPSSGPLGRKRPAAEVAHPDWLSIRAKLVYFCADFGVARVSLMEAGCSWCPPLLLWRWGGTSSGIFKSKTSQLLRAHLTSIKESVFDQPRINLQVCARSHA